MRGFRQHFLPLITFTALLLCGRSEALTPRDYAIELSASTHSDGHSILISWPADARTKSISIARRDLGERFWSGGAGPLPGTDSSYLDTSAVAGKAYEYVVTADAQEGSQSYGRFGCVIAGTNVPITEVRGTALLLVESSVATPLAAELSTFVQDLIGDGWAVIRKDVPASSRVDDVRALIAAEYASDPANVNTLILFGHIPVPYSGDIWPDMHPDHKGAWPADVIYGDMDGSYTSVGEGRYAQSSPPYVSGIAGPELNIGRIDLSNLPAFQKSEVELLRQYLNKDHAFRQRLVTVPSKAIVDDNLGILDGWEATAANGWRNFAPLIGRANVAAANWESANSSSFLFGYGCGPSGFTNVGGVVSTSDLATRDYNVTFNLLFGSYFGDWNTQDNALRAPLASGSGLTSAWVGRPNWFLHPLGLGVPVGYCAKITQRNIGDYTAGVGQNQIHIALMGDPTLRIYPMVPVTNIQSSAQAGGGVRLTWTASPDAALGYHVYVSDSPNGPFSRLTTSPVTSPNYTYSASAAEKTFMVRAVKLETTPSGSFYNASQGAFLTYSTTVPETPVVTMSVVNGIAEELGPKPGSIKISRTGSTTSALTVNLTTSGTATNGVDYAAVPSTVSIPAGAADLVLNITPVADSVAEGPETVNLTIKSGAGYDLGAVTSGSVSILDTPRDDWRFSRFTAQEIADSSISGLNADPDRDGINNLCEFGFGLDPKKGSASGRPVTSLVSVGTNRFLQLAYRRNKQATDILFTVEVSDDLGVTWVSGANYTDLISKTDLGDGCELIVVRDREALGGSARRFMRLKLSM